MNSKIKYLLPSIFFLLLLLGVSSIYGRTKFRSGPSKEEESVSKDTIRFTLSNTTDLNLTLEIKQYYRGKADSPKINLPTSRFSFGPKKTESFSLPFRVGANKEQIYFLAKVFTQEEGYVEGVSALAVDITKKRSITGRFRTETETVRLGKEQTEETVQKVVLRQLKSKSLRKKKS